VCLVLESFVSSVECLVFRISVECKSLGFRDQTNRDALDEKLLEADAAIQVHPYPANTNHEP
jgi:hypothetical protein